MIWLIFLVIVIYVAYSLYDDYEYICQKNNYNHQNDQLTVQLLYKIITFHYIFGAEVKS